MAMKTAARGEMYHALTFEDFHAERGRELLVIDISEELGDKIRALPTNDRHRLQSALLNLLEERVS